MIINIYLLLIIIYYDISLFEMKFIYNLVTANLYIIIYILHSMIVIKNRYFSSRLRLPNKLESAWLLGFSQMYSLYIGRFAAQMPPIFTKAL